MLLRLLYFLFIYVLINIFKDNFVLFKRIISWPLTIYYNFYGSIIEESHILILQRNDRAHKNYTS
jgi:hypothetical protein